MGDTPNSYVNDFWSQDKMPSTMTQSTAGSAAGGALGGAGTGAAIGSLGGPVGTAVGAAVGGIAGAIGGLFGGGGEESGYSLPKVFEYDLMNSAEANLQGISQDLNRATTAYNLYDQRMKTIDGLIKATIPSQQALKELRNNSMDIAQALGQDAQSLIDNGFLDENDIADLEQLGALESGSFADPVLENQIMDERARLEQDLRRQGASPATRAQALSQFDRQAEESRFTRAEELKTSQFNRISGKVQLRQGLKESNLQRTLSGYGAGIDQMNQARTGIGMRSDIAGARYNASGNLIAQRQGLRTERMGTFESLGKFKFSNYSQEMATAGVYGPRAGMMSETNSGVRSELGSANAAKYRSEQEKLQVLRQAQFFANRTKNTGMPIPGGYQG